MFEGSLPTGRFPLPTGPGQEPLQFGGAWLCLFLFPLLVPERIGAPAIWPFPSIMLFSSDHGGGGWRNRCASTGQSAASGSHFPEHDWGK